MIVKEAEAKGKWCPFSRGEGGVNRHGPGSGDEVRCIGSACMAWQWEEEGNAFRVHNNALQQWLDRGYRSMKTPDADYNTVWMPQENRTGFCGMTRNPNPLYITSPGNQA